jgi:membrane protein implicated in regulation of membrane protease activity
LGTDVYDKILILQALRRRFSRAIFFTTDLDARLLDPQHLPWTRHLIVGSSFGLALRPEFQGDIPPFRDTYQTSVYLSTLLAVDRAGRQQDRTDNPAAVQKSAPSKPVPPWVAEPRIFEIGRSDAFDLTAIPSSGECLILRDCADLFPHGSKAAWDNQHRLVGFLLSSGLFALFLMSIRIACGRMPSWIAMTLIGGVLIGITTSYWPWWVGLIDNAGYQLSSVPIFSGASMCLAWCIELLSIVAVVALVWRGKRMLDRNSGEIQCELVLPSAPAQLIARHEAALSKANWVERAREWVWFPIGASLLAAEPVQGQTTYIQIEELLGQYLFRGSVRKRTYRVSAATLLWTLLLLPVNWLVGTNFIQSGDLPSSTGGEDLVSKSLSLVSCFAIQFLVLWVADAMLLSRAFTLDVSRSQLKWPAPARVAAMRQVAMPATAAEAWWRLRLVAVRTECVATLVWYPSIVLAAMGVAAFTVEFGRFRLASNPVALVLSAAIVVASAAGLRRSAEELRTRTIELLEDARSRALRTHRADSPQAAQYECLIARVTDMSEGAFAPYSQQPLVRALIVPAASYGGGLLLQYYHVGTS